MSAYLAERILAHPRIHVRTGSSLRELHGDDTLESVVVAGDGMAEHLDCRGLFCFIGAEPASAWMNGVAKDGAGFVLTDSRLPAGTHEAPLPFQTSTPRVFAVGDVRAGSIKRVAAAVGEGSACVQFVHKALAEPWLSRAAAL